MALQSRSYKCTEEVHLFDVQRKRLGIRCRCGQKKNDFEYLQGYNLTIRVNYKKPPKKIDFSGVN